MNTTGIFTFWLTSTSTVIDTWILELEVNEEITQNHFLWRKRSLAKGHRWLATILGPCKTLISQFFLYTSFLLYISSHIEKNKTQGRTLVRSLTSQPSETKSQKSVILSQILVVDITNIPKPYYLLKADTSFLQQLGFSFFCSLNNYFMNS